MYCDSYSSFELVLKHGLKADGMQIDGSKGLNLFMLAALLQDSFTIELKASIALLEMVRGICASSPPKRLQSQ